MYVYFEEREGDRDDAQSDRAVRNVSHFGGGWQLFLSGRCLHLKVAELTPSGFSFIL